LFDKNFLLDGKSIRTEKDPVKDKNRPDGQRPKVVFFRKWDFAGLEFTK
jgi:hypothetical protein